LADKVDRLENPAFLNTLSGLMEDGAFTKAVKHLLSNGVHDSLDLQVQAKLEALHPKAPPISNCPEGCPWPWPTDDEEKAEAAKQLRQVILHFPKGSAGGPSGLRPQHLQDVLRMDLGASAIVLSAIMNFLHLSLDGGLPPQAAPFLCAANVVPLKKPGGVLEVRPVAVGETLRRIVAKFAMDSPVAKRAVESLQPTQCGVGIAGACETVAIGLQNWVNAHQGEADWLVLQVDLCNAFNSLQRAPLLEEAHALAPELLAWTRFCYA
jgi:hypothetical protein